MLHKRIITAVSIFSDGIYIYRTHAMQATRVHKYHNTRKNRQNLLDILASNVHYKKQDSHYVPEWDITYTIK